MLLPLSGMRRRCGEEGSSLVEVLIAAGILLVALVSLAHLLTLGIRDNIRARAATYETILAGQKLEELRATTPVPSPPNALDADTPGFVDYLDRFGHVLAGGAQPPRDAMYTRRWAIEPSPADPLHALIVQVTVVANAAAGNRLGSGSRVLTLVRR